MYDVFIFNKLGCSGGYYRLGFHKVVTVIPKDSMGLSKESIVIIMAPCIVIQMSRLALAFLSAYQGLPKRFIIVIVIHSTINQNVIYENIFL